MFRVSCLGIWWRHDIWISKKLKFDYLKKEKSFRSEIKNIFPGFISAHFQTYKTNSKNVANTIFKNFWSKGPIKLNFGTGKSFGMWSPKITLTIHKNKPVFSYFTFKFLSCLTGSGTRKVSGTTVIQKQFFFRN